MDPDAAGCEMLQECPPLPPPCTMLDEWGGGGASQLQGGAVAGVTVAVAVAAAVGVTALVAAGAGGPSGKGGPTGAGVAEVVEGGAVVQRWRTKWSYAGPAFCAGCVKPAEAAAALEALAGPAPPPAGPGPGQRGAAVSPPPPAAGLPVIPWGCMCGCTGNDSGPEL